ncbi:MAG: hypothetical protein R6X14_05785 [bacterium]
MTGDIPIYDKHGRPQYRLCDQTFFDYQGKPRGFLVGEAVYDTRGQHRGFYRSYVMRDRMGMVIGFTAGAAVEGLSLPLMDIPPVPYRNLPAPEPSDECRPMECREGPPRWSMMPLANMLIL